MASKDDKHKIVKASGSSSEGLDSTRLLPKALRPGTLLKERYLVEEELGRGGMGAVYLVRDQLLLKSVVVKILLEQAGRNQWIVRKFKQEKEALARVEHPGIVGVLDAGETPEGQPFIVMQYVKGVTLRSVMKPEEGMDFEHVAHIIKQIGDALDAAHSEGVLHRDLKPENVMLQTTRYGHEQVKLIDFGVAKIRDSVVAPSTVTNRTVGTVSYMSPEQLKAQPVSTASDIYALGVIAFEMVTGRRPFNPDSMFQLLEMQRTGIRVRPRDLRPSLSEVAQEVILRALEFDPSRRYQRARDFSDELAGALTITVVAQPQAAPEISPSERPTKKRAKPRSASAEARRATAPHKAGARTAKRVQARSSGKSKRQGITGSNLAHVLFMDIVSFSVLPPDEQVQIIEELQRVVARTTSFRDAQRMGKLISLDTGDGMALAFFDDYEAPVRCAVEISTALTDHPEIKLRMGVNTGPVYRRKGIGDQINMTGDGINIAQQVMDCGDEGHILVSKTVADFLIPFKRWTKSLHELGPHKVKHDVPVHLFNLCTDEFGNPEMPRKLRAARGERGRETPEPKVPESSPRTWRVDPSERQIVEALPRAAGQEILVQTLGVSHYRAVAGSEGLMYAPAPLGEVAPDSVFVPLKWQILQRKIEEIRARVEDLTRRALVGQKRDGIGIEAAARALSDSVLPAAGLVGMLGAGIHPQFDLVQDAASEIPWEVLEEFYYVCPKCSKRTLPHRSSDPTSDASQTYCAVCGERMERTGGKLALTCHLTHLVRGAGRYGGEGKQFLFIEDPLGDLCSLEKDPHQICAKHLSELRNMIEQQGYEINLLTKKNATINYVLAALNDPTVVGIYYFGHGFFPRNGDEGCLLLADGQLLASQVMEIAPFAKFVFLNACEGAASTRDWGLEKRGQSVANAFARGGRGKVVIAPIWPVVNVQAAATALNFFRQALRATPLGEALRIARAVSLQGYETGEPDISWGAYRYFGDPNRMLPVPNVAQVVVGPDVVAPQASRIFDSDGELHTEQFAFAIDEVLLRAAKRRNLQKRKGVSVIDFLAGLIRKGDLTRFVLRQRGLDPDELYQSIGLEVETEPKTATSGVDDQQAGSHRTGTSVSEAITGNGQEGSDEEELRELVARWVVRQREDFNEPLVRILERADQLAQQRATRTEDTRISEQDILEALISDASWGQPASARLLSADEVRRALQDREKFGVDENGEISLHALDSDARRIIETVHELAQQRGAFPIPNRLMLAAFLTEEKSEAATWCRKAGYDPELLYLMMMIGLAEQESEGDPSPSSFGLSLEACERIVTPVIEGAMKVAKNAQAITAAELFASFRLNADPHFKDWLKQPPLPVDLDRQDTPPPPPPTPVLDPAAQRVTEMAHRLAQDCGAFPISNRLVLAAFLSEPQGHVARLFERHHIPAADLRKLLIESSATGVSRSFPLDHEARSKVVSPMLERAMDLAHSTEIVTEELLFRAFCEVAPPEFKQALLASPWKVDLDALSSDTEDTEKVPGLNRELFEEDVWRTLSEAGRLASLQGWTEIRTPHLFAAMIGDESSPVRAALRQKRLEPDEVKRILLALVPSRASTPGSPVTNLGENARQIITRALHLANSESRKRVSGKDLFKAFFADGGGVVGEVLNRLGLQSELAAGENGGSPVLSNAASGVPGRDNSVLANFGVDLTEKARLGQLPEIVGRDTEIETTMQTLLLTENANPLLVGEAGVGKTAVVEGLAQRIARGHCPKKLRSMRLIELSAGSLVADTRLRGEFEQRIQEVLAAARSKVILFIDEIHTIVGAGSAEGSGPDAGNMLKTALARGEVRLIGATTHAEYKRTIARDKALSRRFQIQMIGPPSREATIHVLSSRQPLLEKHHGVRITEEAKAAAVDLSGRYILDKQWPAKARDVLERACVIAVTRTETSQTEDVVEVTAEQVAQVVSRQTGIPLEKVSTSELSALATLEERLGQRIIGQPQAIQAVVEAIRRGRHGLADKNRPWGAFLLVGPPGVGKTELAKVIAEEVYGDQEGLIRFDMGDFTEPHSVAKLIGSPPGYVGYTEGAPLVERLRIHPYSLLLFDEIEHAHENVLTVLLRLLSEGTLVDNEGNMADARNSIVILTSNLLGRETEVRRPGFVPEAKSDAALTAQAGLRVVLEKHLPPKLIDRLDAIVRFNPLTPSDLEAIAGRRVAGVVSRVAALHGVSVEVEPAVLLWLVQKAASESSGARAIQRAVDNYLAAPLGAFLSCEQTARANRICVSVAEDAIQVNAASGSS